MSKIYFENMLDKNFLNFFPPTPSSQAVPSWWKNMKKTDKDFLIRKSIKNCPAISDTLYFGYTLYTQCDIYITSDENSVNWYTEDNVLYDKSIGYISSHHPEQIQQYAVPEGYVPVAIKIHPGFGIRTERGYSSWITHPMHRNDLPFMAVDGIVDTDRYIADSPFALFFKKNLNHIVKAGTPFVQIVPFKRTNFSMSIVEHDKDKSLQQVYSARNSFFSGYKKNFWSRKTFR